MTLAMESINQERNELEFFHIFNFNKRSVNAITVIKDGFSLMQLITKRVIT